MVNIDKIKTIAKSNGIKLKFICHSIGVSEAFLRDVKVGKCGISPDRLAKIASILHTTPEYLRDETDDPAPVDDKKEKPGARSAEPESPLDNQLFDILPHLNEAQKRFLLDQAELLYERQQAKASDSHH